MKSFQPGAHPQQRPVYRPGQLGPDRRQHVQSPFGARTPGRGRIHTPFTQSHPTDSLEQSITERAQDMQSLDLAPAGPVVAETSALTCQEQAGCVQLSPTQALLLRMSSSPLPRVSPQTQTMHHLPRFQLTLTRPTLWACQALRLWLWKSRLKQQFQGLQQHLSVQTWSQQYDVPPMLPSGQQGYQSGACSRAFFAHSVCSENATACTGPPFQHLFFLKSADPCKVSWPLSQ